jgi:D-glycero-alpha-D-manno-heptose-7-phosphate kinase
MRLVTARAPARIDFGGGWTDVPPYDREQGGCVCNLAISRHVTVSLTERAGGIEIDEDGTTVCADSAAALPRVGSSALVAAALRSAKATDMRVRVRSHFPAGAGLGGSSAAGVAMVGALAAWRGESPSRAEVAELSRAVEVDELGIAGGRQDHYAAAFGGALGLWFGEGVRVEPIEIGAELIDELERRCIVAYTGRTRISGETITAVLDGYAARDAGVTAALRRIRELAEEMIRALAAGSIDTLGALVGEHWVHQRRLHPSITTPEIDALLASATSAGALGGKALGASGGGCVMVIAPDDAVPAVRAAIARYAELVPFMVDRTGLTTTILDDS